ncbi:tetratricopeptide repeat protein [Nocardia suismassiliense]|uniref:Tetratricopeptide repeat protein n=1 Tax=Nocardia suismassiliense TaxID=2077092 RepID=A0ABW6R5P5_9NOCA
MIDATEQPLTGEGHRLLHDENRDGRIEAIAVLEQAVEAGEHDAPRWLAQALVASNRYEDACEVLVAAVGRGRTDLAGLLGSFAHEAGLVELAEDSYRKSLAAGFPYAMNDFGTFLREQERYDEAVELLRSAVDAGDTLAPGNLVRLFAVELEDLDTALELGERYLDPNKPTTHTALADVYERLGRLDEAQRLYESAIELGAPRRHVLYGMFLRDFRDDLAGAEREFRLAFDNDEADWGHNLGALLLATDREDEALDVLDYAASWGDRESARLLAETEAGQPS